MGMGPYVECDYSEPAAAAVGGVAGFMLVFLLLFYLLMLAWGIVSYVLYSLSMYKIAQRRGIHHPWLSWVPVGNLWVLGSISDQYQYVAKQRVRNRRKVLVGLYIGLFATLIPVIVGAVGVILNAESNAAANGAMVGAMAALMLLAYLAMVVLMIVLVVFEYIALYDLFCSCEPGNAVLYLVLSIVFGVVLPFFLFSCRNKDLGMPPRKQPARPVYPAMERPVEQPAPAEQPAEAPVEQPAAPAEEAPAEETPAEETEE